MQTRGSNCSPSHDLLVLHFLGGTLPFRLSFWLFDSVTSCFFCSDCYPRIRPHFFFRWVAKQFQEEKDHRGDYTSSDDEWGTIAFHWISFLSKASGEISLYQEDKLASSFRFARFGEEWTVQERPSWTNESPSFGRNPLKEPSGYIEPSPYRCPTYDPIVQPTNARPTNARPTNARPTNAWPTTALLHLLSDPSIHWNADRPSRPQSDRATDRSTVQRDDPLCHVKIRKEQKKITSTIGASKADSMGEKRREQAMKGTSKVEKERGTRPSQVGR